MTAALVAAAPATPVAAAWAAGEADAQEAMELAAVDLTGRLAFEELRCRAVFQEPPFDRPKCTVELEAPIFDRPRCAVELEAPKPTRAAVVLQLPGVECQGDAAPWGGAPELAHGAAEVFFEHRDEGLKELRAMELRAESRAAAAGGGAAPEDADEQDRRLGGPRLRLKDADAEVEDTYADSCCSSDSASEPSYTGTPSAPLTRSSSDMAFDQPEQTLIIFDWDDTLCPSTACMERLGMPSEEAPPLEGALAEELGEVARHAGALIQLAGELAAQVMIVTNGGDGWVDSSCGAWLPALRSSLRTVEVVSARANWEPRGFSSPTEWKTYEFEDVIGRFYSRYDNQSWKNIIVIGDAPYEHVALQRVVERAPYRNCRSKSVRFQLKPSIEDLARQLSALRDALQSIAVCDESLDMYIPNSM